MTALVDDDRIAAFVDGELPSAEMAAIEAAAAVDPALADRIERAQALRAAVASAFADSVSQPVPARLLATIRGGAEVVDLSDERARRSPASFAPAAARWGAIAASLALAFFAGRVLIPAQAPPVIASGPGGLIASGALAVSSASWPRPNRPMRR
jgi:anti-sigma factor RsiW